MKTFTQRRIRNFVLLILLCTITLFVFQIIELTLLVQQYYSGWLLVAVILVLMFFGVKKRLSVIPMGSNAGWAQVHYYSGLFLVFLFLIHIEFSLPNGIIEQTLALLLVLTAFVGIIGLLLSRIYARRLSHLDEQVIYERVEIHRIEIKENVESELLKSIERSNSSTLSSYYLEHLAAYFSQTQDRIAHLLGSNYPHRKRRAQLEQQLRYLNKEEADFVIRLLAFLEQKNTLDCHSALQGVLKFWSLLHVPIGILTSLLAGFHIVLVYAFRGAM